MVLTYSDAHEVSIILRARAEKLDLEAAKMDEFQDEKKNYTAQTREWAKTAKVDMIERAKAFRSFAKDTLKNSVEDGR